MNKAAIFQWLVNIGWVVGVIISREYDVVGWYLLITTSLMCIAYRKQLWYMMKLGGDMYARFCRKTGNKITKKVFKDIDDDCDSVLKQK